MICLNSELADTFVTSTSTTPKESNSKFSSRSSGRWTKEEHQKFVEGLRKFGKNWKQVEEFVGTRNGAQIRSHAQKFFNRLEREYNVKLNNGKAPATKKKGKESVRKVSDNSICTYNSSVDTLSDDCKTEVPLKEESVKNDVMVDISKFEETAQAETPVLNKPLVSSEEVKDLIKDVLILCKQHVESAQIGSPANEGMISYSFYDIISKISSSPSADVTLKVPKLSDLVAMPMERSHIISIDNVAKVNQQNISCSFRICHKKAQEDNISKKLTGLRKGQMLEDVIVKKLKL